MRSQSVTELVCMRVNATGKEDDTVARGSDGP